MSPSDITRRVREICRAMPEVTERLSHGSPAFFVRRQFVMLWPGTRSPNCAPTPTG